MRNDSIAGGRIITLAVLSCGFFAISFVSTASADRLTSPNYQIDTSVAAPFGGQSSSANYKLVTGGGEAVNSNPVASSSYSLGQGYVAQLPQSIQLTIPEASVNLGTITPGISKKGNFTPRIVTDAAGYTLSLSQNANLTSGSNTIPAISGGTIATPVVWNEGTTKGLGLSLTAAPSLPAKWGTSGSYKYTAIPGSSTAAYTRTGYSGGAQDNLSMELRVDVPSSQAQGAYTSTVTLTATLTP